MRIIRMRILVVAAFVAGLALAATLFTRRAESQVFDEGAIVKLYSGDKVVASWKAIAMGHADGDAFVFYVGSSTSPTEVRIQGTYSVERLP